MNEMKTKVEPEQKNVITENLAISEEEEKDFTIFLSLHEEIKQCFVELEVFNKLKKETTKKIENYRKIYYETKGCLEERYGKKRVTLFRTEILEESV